MEKLLKLLDLREAKGDFGVEIECEGADLVPVDDGGWESKHDGSLRGVFPHSAIEWVFAKPLSLDKSIVALNYLIRKQKAGKAKPLFSFRTSTHVHINMQQANEDQLCAMIYTYCLIEELLVNFAGPSRKANRFCLSINDGEGVLDYFMHVFKIGAPALRVNENEVRYAALNIASLRKFGSLEVRLMRGTMDLEVLTTWLCSMSTMRDFAFSMENPRNVHDFYIKSGPEEFMKAVFPETHAELEYKGWIDDVQRNFSITLELAYAFVSAEERTARKGVEFNEIVGKRAKMVIMDDMAQVDPVWPAVPAPQIAGDVQQRIRDIQREIRAQREAEEANRGRRGGWPQAANVAPPRPRDENGRFIPGIVYDPFRREWVAAAEF